MELGIGVIAKSLGLTTETLRSWERQGLIPKARRKGLKGARVWTEEQVKEINTYRQTHYRY